jgi:two-component system KDP operon response regulator KdpE
MSAEEKSGSGTPATVLVIDDELPIRRFLRATLETDGFRVVEAENATEGLRQAATRSPDVVVLDLGLPDQDGLEVTRRLREWTTIPIVVLSARGRETDKIAALDAGADDYVTKPFGAGELMARVRVALRHRARATDQGDPVLRVGDLEIDLGRRRVSVAGTEVHLTPTEYRLLSVLARHAGKVLTHTFLLKEVWGPGYSGQTHYLRVYMGQLRQKLEKTPARPRYFVNEPGVGYRLRDE